jgi:glutaminase
VTSAVRDQVQHVFDHCRPLTGGAVADYIPELARVDPEQFGLAATVLTGETTGFGDVDIPFTIQSVSKPFSYALALELRGFDEVDAHIDVEPSGEAFNQFSLDPVTGHPRNAMINAGAITATSLIPGDAEQATPSLLTYLSRFVGHPIAVDEKVYRSESETGHRNRAIAHLLRSVDVLEGAPDDVLDTYFRQCSALVSARDLSLMAATLANGGVQPVTGEALMSPRVLRRVLSVMATCGLYDGAGDWLTNVGLPAKSGVSGAILAVLPGRVGAAVWSPRLNEHGNSVRGVAAFRMLSDEFGLHVFEVHRSTATAAGT